MGKITLLTIVEKYGGIEDIEPEEYAREHHIKDNEGNIIATTLVPTTNLSAQITNRTNAKWRELLKGLELDEDKIIKIIHQTPFFDYSKQLAKKLAQSTEIYKRRT